MSMIKTRLREFKLSGIYNSYEERINMPGTNLFPVRNFWK